MSGEVPKVAFLFPGQGSQQVGMGRELSAAYPRVKKDYFDRANEILGFDITGLCFEGPEEALVETQNQQPAIFLASVAASAVLQEEGIMPSAVAGHSLGEYSALVAAGVLDFETGLRLTRRRGELMAEVAAKTGGMMAAILGLPSGQVEKICREAKREGIVEVANYNSSTQTVISGEDAAVAVAMDLARDKGAKRVVALNVGAPFHCSLMAPLADSFSPALETSKIADPQIPVVANVTADYEKKADEVRTNLIKQLASPVHWSESIDRLIGDGIETFVEVGPGRVLSGLTRSINRSVTVLSTEDGNALEKTLSALHQP